MDQLFDGRRLRALTLVDNYTGECLAIDIEQDPLGDDVIATLGHACALRGLPRIIKTDNDSEFISKAMDRRAYENEMTIYFSRASKPAGNAQCESFNGSSARSA